jgi:hypothetical protein
MWGAAGFRDSTSTIRAITYGQMPEGYYRLDGQGDTALTLVPGCYAVTVIPNGSMFFDVHPDGAVVERP